MKNLIVVVFSMLTTFPVLAATEAPATVVVSAPVSAPVVAVDAGSVKEVALSAEEMAMAITAYKAAKGKTDKAAMSLVLMGLLAAVFKLVLSAMKLTGTFWKTPKGKMVVRLSTVGLGAAVFLLSKVAGGMGWSEALVAGMSGPLAIAFHEYVDMLPTFSKKVAAPAPEAPKNA